LQKLHDAGLQATLHLHAGNPKRVLIEEAEAWNADAIFVGANAFGSRLEKFILGSVSAAVAARAHCSVEVVRR
jgi:nucleotide-binding universal stress UspA family protein